MSSHYCTFKNRNEEPAHYLDRFRDDPVKLALADKILDLAEILFDMGKRRPSNRPSKEGPRYVIDAVSYEWQNQLFIVVLEHIGACSLKVVTIYPKS